MSSSPPSTDRRTLQLADLDALSVELDRIESAEQAGQLVAVGSWTPGQILGHVAAWIHYGWEGYPINPPPRFVRWFLRWRLPKMLKGSMPSGVRIPGVEGGTTGIEPVEFGQGLSEMRRGIQRMRGDDPAKFHSPAFGEMSMADRIELNLRHAELHFSFLRYPGDGG
ncbi:DUF1569 domain-containing protein [Aeoliella sp. ICT_H6.2]|uniref:DUF1569 domain-containing protein n=1 Tax=Aeoliella straminimaris TaxID=2954799 RepID=A0A9X2F654_9BACT|nr:DUF1569 domain-containing protein [Aeoliella straminimaris]MCO6042337.1 DUF1569 domain-containing protein [Aeoliella straminimaris]